MKEFRILLVDDEPSIRVVLSAVLRSGGYVVDLAEDGFGALRSIQAAIPDLIISDLRMPNMNGFELLSVVRTKFPQMPVIAISGEFVSNQVEGVLADVFFQKGSYSPADLMATVETLLKSAPMPANRMTNTSGIPVWAPTGDAPIMITCTDCLRSFPIDPCTEGQTRGETHCIFCGAALKYRLLAVTRSA